MTEYRYEGLARELSGWIAAGKLARGERLPSVRQLARDRQLSVSTVVQALHLLEDQGLIEARPQSGHFVRHPPPRLSEPAAVVPPVTATPVDISQRIVRAMQAGSRTGIAPLAAALPANELLPLAALNRLYARVARLNPQLLTGGSHVDMDDPALRRQLAKRSLSWGRALAAEEFVITNSCTEALSLCLRAVTQPGDTVAVESPAYYLMLQLLESLGLRALEIPTDPRTGLSVEALELASRNGSIAACLIVPNGSNPLGHVMPDEHKRRLAALASERGFPIIEDDIYGDLHLCAHRPSTIKAFDTTGNVMLCASFSKSLSPALRIGFVAGGRYHSAIALQKAINSGATNPITQRVLAEFIGSTAYERHLRRLRQQYQRQLSAMQEAVARHFPAGTRVSQPQAGYVLWIELPGNIDTAACHEQAMAEGLAYVPGDLFSPSRLYRNCLRLNCGNPHSALIEDALRRLGELFRNTTGITPTS